MEQILVARETVVKYFKRYEMFIVPFLKFLLGVYVFTMINGIGHGNPEYLKYVENLPALPFSFLMGILFVVLPLTLSWLLIILNITLQYTAGLEVALIVFVVLIFLLLFYARMAVKESILILFTIIAFHFKMQYLLPVLVGLYFPLSGIIPVTLGVFLYSHIPVIETLAVTSSTAALEITELPQAFLGAYTTVLTSLTSTQTWLFTSFIFAMVIVIVHVVSRLAVDFAKEISILLGSVLMIFGFLVSMVVAQENIAIIEVILGSLLGGALAVVVRFFDSVLDYQRAESVQFEDDNNYYVVRIVPKVIMTKRKRVVRRIRSQPEDDD
jgi:hypothetical protein